MQVTFYGELSSGLSLSGRDSLSDSEISGVCENPAILCDAERSSQCEGGILVKNDGQKDEITLMGACSIRTSSAFWWPAFIDNFIKFAFHFKTSGLSRKIHLISFETVVWQQIHTANSSIGEVRESKRGRLRRWISLTGKAGESRIFRIKNCNERVKMKQKMESLFN